MRRVVLLGLLVATLLGGVGSAIEPSVCTDPCGEEENGSCEIPACDACISLAVVPAAPETPALPATPVDLGAVESAPSPPRIEPPATEIPHVPRPFLG